MTAPAPTVEVVSAPIEDTSVSFPERLITGTVARYGVPANTSAGRIIVLPGDVEVSDPGRVAFLREHNRAGDSLGHAVAVWDEGDRLRASFRVAPGPSGDRALAEAASGVRTGLSFGLDILANLGQLEGATRVRGLMREVSHVVVPAWDDARITATASIGAPVTLPVQPAPAPVAPAPVQYGQPAPVFGYGQPAPAAPPAPAPVHYQTQPAPYTTAGLYGAPAQSPTDHLVASLEGGMRELLDQLRRGISPTPGTAVPLVDPSAPAPAGSEPAADGIGLEAFASLVSDVATGRGNAWELTAALADVIPANAPGAFRAQYLDELWDATDTPRKFIDNAMTVRPLTSMKIIGQRWVNKPTVGDYAGDKTEVPTGPVSLEDVPVTARRMAGAHDVDRAYIDLGSPEWFTGYFEAQAEDYRAKTDAKAALDVWTATTKLAAQPDLIAGVIASVVAMANVGKDVEYVAMSPGLVSALFGVTTQEAPAFFTGGFQLSGGGDGGLGGLKWFTTTGLGAGQVLVGQKAAARWHEVSPPIRVQALNVAQGGVDLGVFGYYADYVRDARAVRGFTIAG